MELTHYVCGKIIDEEKHGSVEYFDFFSFSFYNFRLLPFMNDLAVEALHS